MKGRDRLGETGGNERKILRFALKIGCEAFDWIHVDYDTGQWRVFVYMVINIRVPQRRGIY
jgi:hypothetical protein